MYMHMHVHAYVCVHMRAPLEGLWTAVEPCAPVQSLQYCLLRTADMFYTHTHTCTYAYMCAHASTFGGLVEAAAHETERRLGCICQTSIDRKDILVIHLAYRFMGLMTGQPITLILSPIC